MAFAPTSLWADAAVLVASFAALAVMWPRPRLEQDRFRPLPAWLCRRLTSRPAESVCGALGFGLLVVLLWPGLFGKGTTVTTIVPTFVYIAFWLGLVLLSVIFGDVFRAWSIDYGVVGAEAFWYIQLALVLGGHLSALVLAHDRALVVYDETKLATRSQYWMLTVMVGFTVLALWLLSEASKG